MRKVFYALRKTLRAVPRTRSTSTMARAAPTAAGHENARPTTTSPKKRHATTSTPWDSPANLDKSYMMTTRQVGGYAAAAAAVPPSDGCAAAVEAANHKQTSRRLRRRSGGCAAERRLRRRRDGCAITFSARHVPAKHHNHFLTPPHARPGTKSRTSTAMREKGLGVSLRRTEAEMRGGARWRDVGSSQGASRTQPAVCPWIMDAA